MGLCAHQTLSSKITSSISKFPNPSIRRPISFPFFHNPKKTQSSLSTPCLQKSLFQFTNHGNRLNPVICSHGNDSFSAPSSPPKGKRTDLKKILILGAGPIVIGQACEFDYSGTQAVKALKEEGYEVILLNSNPATIMTDPDLADRTYIAPMTPELVEQVLEQERPDAILPTMGGQTALNLAVALAENGALERYGVELIGAKLEAIKKAEDRNLFKQAMANIGVKTPSSGIGNTLDECMEIAESIDGESVKAFRGGFNVSVNEEYRSVFRTKSYAEILIKAKLLLVNHPSSSPSSSSFTCANSFSDFLLEPAQEAIATILETTIFSKKPKIRTLIHDYFQISAEASRICSNLLTSINQFHTNYQFIQRALNISRLASEYPSPDQDHLNIKYLVSQLKSFHLLDNPFSNPNQHDFELIRDRYTSVLHRLKSKKKKVTRKMKLIKCFKRASGVCVAAACSVATVVALVIAAHTLLVLLMGPAILSLPCSKKKKWMSFGFCRSGILRRIGMQLDVAAKGAYILNRDIDTMSRLVTRLHDEIDHSKAMIQFCLDRKDDRFCLQEVVKELGKSDNGLRKQVEDLEEHVYLCLITINRARVLVIKEMTASVARS